MKTGIDPCVDYAFKRVFGSAENLDVLSSFLQAVLNTSDDSLTELVLLNPFNEKESATDKLSVLDVKARDSSSLGSTRNVIANRFGTRTL